MNDFSRYEGAGRCYFPSCSPSLSLHSRLHCIDTCYLTPLLYSLPISSPEDLPTPNLLASARGSAQVLLMQCILCPATRSVHCTLPLAVTTLLGIHNWPRTNFLSQILLTWLLGFQPSGNHTPSQLTCLDLALTTESQHSPKKQVRTGLWAEMKSDSDTTTGCQQHTQEITMKCQILMNMGHCAAGTTAALLHKSQHFKSRRHNQLLEHAETYTKRYTK